MIAILQHIYSISTNRLFQCLVGCDIGHKDALCPNTVLSLNACRKEFTCCAKKWTIKVSAEFNLYFKLCHEFLKLNLPSIDYQAVGTKAPTQMLDNTMCLRVWSWYVCLCVCVCVCDTSFVIYIIICCRISVGRQRILGISCVGT